jgi:signal transduction histidine kinase
VRISARDLDHWIEFTVNDNGPGIAAQFHERIFGVFQTLRSRDEVEGSGMGLAIVKRIVESRGGTVRIQSEPGQGATFIFTWPVVPAEGPVAAPKDTA